MASPLIESRTSIAVALEPSASALAPATPSLITASAVTQTTIVSADLSAANDYAYVGLLAEALDGNVAGEFVMIRNFVNGTDTAYVDPFSNASPTATQFRLWTPPDPILQVSALSADTTHIDASNRTEANDYWNDPDRYYAVKLSAAGTSGSAIVRGEAQLVSDFVAATDRFTTGAFTAAPAAGDLFVLRRPVKLATPGEIALPEITRGYVDRDLARNDWQSEPGVRAGRGGNISWPFEIKGARVSASGATPAEAAIDLEDLLLARMTKRATDGTSAVVAGGDTSNLWITNTESSRFAVGNLLLVNGQMAIVTAIAASDAAKDILTIAPALSVYPATGTTVFGGVTWWPKTTGHQSLTAEIHEGNTSRLMCYGWMPRLKITGLAHDQVAKIMAEGPISFYMENDVALPYTVTYDTKAPLAARHARVLLGGATVACIGAEIDLGYVIEVKPLLNPVGNDGPVTVGKKTVGTLRIWKENMNEQERFFLGGLNSLLVQVGNTTTDCFGFYADRIEYTNVTTSKEVGSYVSEVSFKVVTPSTAGITTDFALGVC